MSPSINWSALSDLFRSPSSDRTASQPPHVSVSTNRSSTVFSGSPEQWVRYLELPITQRREHPLSLDILLDVDAHRVRFHPGNEPSVRWARRLEQGIAMIQERLQHRPRAGTVLHSLLFENDSNTSVQIHVHATRELPGEATREVQFDTSLHPVKTDIVLHADLLDDIDQRIEQLPKSASSSLFLGTLWPILHRVVSQLGYPSYPRDRFKDRIQLTACMSFLTLQLLFEGKKKGRLKPNEAGDVFLEFAAAHQQIPRKRLEERDPYFRMLNDMSFVAREEQWEAFQDAVRVIARDYLDQYYLRISVAGIMPGLLDHMAPMPFELKKKRKVSRPSPSVGRYGLLDDEDLSAWKKMQSPLEELGLVILRQLGIGQFGRVYEALNVGNSHFPQRVAVKVDRIRKKHKKEAIQAVETIMEISRGLSASPHVIRVHDAGRLKPLGSTYHILQLVDGDTLDNLIGVTGEEHSSVLRPHVGRTDLQELRGDYLKAIYHSSGERWRRDRASLPFSRLPSLGQALDILTSSLLWIEECHSLGFAINDLKNGNVMISRRGQLKGIDLDTYSPIYTDLDKLSDFFFLAITLLLFVLRVMTHGHDETIRASGLLGDMDALRATLRSLWPYGELAEATDGRLRSQEVLDWMVSTMDASRDGRFAYEPAAFSSAIDELINLKRRLNQEEMILD